MSNLGKLPWKDTKLNSGIEAALQGETKAVDGIMVNEVVVCILPEFPKMMPMQKEALVKAFGGRLVRVEVQVTYTLTGRYYDPSEFKPKKKVEE